MKSKLYLTFVTFVISIMLFPMLGQAQTPDGVTPANEGVCDELIGATPGLYGLCVAFCEAQDLDEYPKTPPSNRILENYEKKMRTGDPEMPCVKKETACPCWDPAELDAIDGSLGPIQCSGDFPFVDISESVAPGGRSAAVYDDFICGYIDSTMTIHDTGIFRLMDVDVEQADSCAAQIVERCDELGL